MKENQSKKLVTSCIPIEEEVDLVAFVLQYFKQDASSTTTYKVGSKKHAALQNRNRQLACTTAQLQHKIDEVILTMNGTPVPEFSKNKKGLVI